MIGRSRLKTSPRLPELILNSVSVMLLLELVVESYYELVASLYLWRCGCGDHNSVCITTNIWEILDGGPKRKKPEPIE